MGQFLEFEVLGDSSFLNHRTHVDDRDPSLYPFTIVVVTELKFNLLGLPLVSVSTKCGLPHELVREVCFTDITIYLERGTLIALGAAPDSYAHLKFMLRLDQDLVDPQSDVELNLVKDGSSYLGQH